jgi:hypothetical protein
LIKTGEFVGRSQPARSVSWVLFLALLIVMGCISYHAGSPLPLKPSPPILNRRATIVIGVEEPPIKLDRPLFTGGETEPTTSMAEIGRAMFLIRHLRASGLFYEVDFKGQLRCEPDLLIRAEKAPRLSDCDADAAMILIYGGVIPAVTTCDVGLYFSRVDLPSRKFDFPWHETELMGWIAPLLNLSPAWALRPDESQMDDTFRAFLLAHESELLDGIERKGAPRCPRR